MSGLRGFSASETPGRSRARSPEIATCARSENLVKCHSPLRGRRERKKRKVEMKNVIWIVLALAGTAGGFFAGEAWSRRAAAKAAVEEPRPADNKDARLVEAKKRIGELEKDLASARRAAAKSAKDAELARKEAEAAQKAVAEGIPSKVVKVGQDGDILGELKNKLSNDEFSHVTNAFSQLRAKLAKRAKSRQDYLASIDVAGMSARERENHTRFMSLLAKREAAAAKMKGGIPDQDTLQEMVQIGLEMATAAKEERSTLLRQVAREMGYAGDDVEVIHDTMKNIFDCTNAGGLGGIGDIAESFGGDGAGVGDVKVSTQVIEVGP